MHDHWRSLPPEVAATVDLIEAGGPFPHPRNDGTTFGNYEGWVKWVPIISLLVFVGGSLLALLYRYRSKERYEAVGKFIHEEA